MKMTLMKCKLLNCHIKTDSQSEKFEIGEDNLQ